MLFIDIVGSTTLAERIDPEFLKLVLDRYFAACVASIDEHGGSVEKFIGDAVLAVFGAAISYEDDAVRAVRAAAGALGAIATLGDDLDALHGVKLQARCGIATGEVVVITTPTGDFRVVGDAVNTAARLQNAARPGEIVIGEQTAMLVRGRVGVEPVEPLRLKGKSAAVPAWRVIDNGGRAAAVAAAVAVDGAPLVGRDGRLAELGGILGEVVRSGKPSMLTVTGPSGIGKSRLLRDFVGSIEAGAATVLWGQCPAYGKGITYDPLVTMLASIPDGWADRVLRVSGGTEVASRAVGALQTIVAAPRDAPPDPHGIRVEGGSDSLASVEEISWATRHLLETLSAERPVIMVWDDLQWAEEALLGLVDDASRWLSDVPVLLVCIGRTEILERRPTWQRHGPRTRHMELEPLSWEQSMALVGALADRADVQVHGSSALQTRIATSCDGNPLFAELMLDFVQRAPDNRVPPTINAVLGARLDQLSDGDRQLVEMAAAVGREFTLATFTAMAAAEQVERPDLTRLLRQRILESADGRSFRFKQSLLRDTAYSSTPKIRRERRHLILARVLRGQRDPLAFAYHVEAAVLLRRELAPLQKSLPAAAGAAADVLIAEGDRALKRNDLSAAAGLLERGLLLLGGDDVRRLPVVLHICDSWIGRSDADRAIAVLVGAEAGTGSDRGASVTLSIQRRIAELRLGLATVEAVSAAADRLAVELDGAQHGDLVWCRYHQLRAYLHLANEAATAAGSELELALGRAQAMGDVYEEERILCATCEVAQWTAQPVSEGLGVCATLAQRFAANRALLVPVLVTKAHMLALGGRIGEARDALREARSHASELHLDLADAAIHGVSGIVDSLAGSHRAAETHFRRAASALREAPQAPDADAADAAVAREVFRQGRVAEAAIALDAIMRGGAARMTLQTRIACEALLARILCAQGDHRRATVAAATAHELSDRVDDVCLVGEVLLDLAVVLEAAGHPDRAATAAARASHLFEAKGASSLAARVTDWLAEVSLAVPASGRTE